VPVTDSDRLIYRPFPTIEIEDIEPKLSEDQRGELFPTKPLDRSWEFVLDDRKIWIAHSTTGPDALIVREYPIIARDRGNPLYGKSPINDNSISLNPGQDHLMTGKRIFRVSPTELVRRNAYILIKHLRK